MRNASEGTGDGVSARRFGLHWRTSLVCILLANAANASGQENITVVATTDVHGRAMHWDYVTDREAPWGLTRAATAIDSIRRADGERVILVDAGDLLQGNLFARFFGTVRTVARNPVVDALNAIGYDAFTPGNHDFDFGIRFLDTAMAYAQFNVVSANVYAGEDLRFREYVTVQRGGIRIGITGATTYGTSVWNRDQLGGQRVVRPLVPEVRRALTRMQEDGVDLKIVLVHSGLDGPSNLNVPVVEPANVAAQLAYLPVKPDLVVMGHSHRVVPDQMVNGVHFVQADPWARGLAVAKVAMSEREEGGYTPGGIRALNVPLQQVQPNVDLVRRLSDAHEAARSWGGLPLGTAPTEWSASFSRAMDTPLIDFINRVQLVASGAQLSSSPSFTTSGGLGPGLVRIRDVHGIYPFENTLKVVTINGAGLKQYIERSGAYFQRWTGGRAITTPNFPGYNYDMVSGVDYVLDLSMPSGSRVRQLVYNGRVVEPSDVFSLALNSYRLSGGGFDMLGSLPVTFESTDTVFEMLIEEVRRVGTLETEAYFEPSWHITPPEAAQAARIAFGAPDSSLLERRAFRVIATTEFGGALESRVTEWSDGKAVGGIDALRGWIDSLSTDCRCVTLRLDAGGAIGGAPSADRSFGVSVVAAMNEIRYDAAVVGEAELMWGTDTLRARIAGARFPWLAANTRLVETDARPDWARDWVMIERDGLRVAVVGLTGRELETPPLPTRERFITTDMRAAAIAAIQQASASGAHHIVVLAHAGAFCDQDGCRGELIDFMESLPVGVDLVVGGHSTSEAVAEINGIPLLLPGSRGLSLGVADILVAPSGTSRAVAEVKTVWADSVRTAPEVAEVSRVAEAVQAFPADSVLTTTLLPISDDGLESGLGRLIADAYRNAARADIAIVHNSSIAGSLPVGTVTYGDVYEIQPVTHVVHRMSVRGEVVRAALEHIVQGAEPIAHVAGLEVQYDPNADPGRRIRRVRLSGDRGFSNGRSYTVAVSGFLAAGGGGFAMFEGVPSVSTGVSDFDALATYIDLLPAPLAAPENARLQPRQ